MFALFSRTILLLQSALNGYLPRVRERREASLHPARLTLFRRWRVRSAKLCRLPPIFFLSPSYRG